MKIYIPSNLKKIKIISQLEEMILGYLNYYSGTIDSFEDYQNSSVNDPVKTFIKLCIPSSENDFKDQSYDDVINYLSKLFYSVKGTIKVFDFMKKYLGLKIVGDIIYTTEYIELNIEEITLADENLFYDSLVNFLNSLLYFRELRTNTELVNLVLSGDVSSSIGTCINKYSNFTVEPYESNN